MLEDVAPLRQLVADVDEADQPHVLARHVHDTVLRSLRSIRSQERRIDLVNALVGHLDDTGASVPHESRQLLALTAPVAPGAANRAPVRPRTPLSDAALLTNSKGEPSLGAELRAEIDSSDEVDLLCAFVKWHGIRLLETELRRMRERGGPFRVITTTYMGATERAALDRLVREFGARSRCSTTHSARGYTPRPGCSGETLASTPRTSARRTCREPPCWRGSSGTCGCPTWAPPACSRSFAPPSTPTGTIRRSRTTTRTVTGTASTTPSRRRPAVVSTTG